MEKLLPVLLAHYLSLQYKIHSIHTNAKGAWFIYLHPFFGEVYQVFWDDTIDWIKERALICGFNTPSNLSEAFSISGITQLDTIPAIRDCLVIVFEDLKFIEWVLQKMIKVSGDELDLVTQNKLIEFQDTIWVLRRKLSNELA